MENDFAVSDPMKSMDEFFRINENRVFAFTFVKNYGVLKMMSADSFVTDVVRRSKDMDGVMIYGARLLAGSLYNFLRKKGIPVTAFCVTKRSSNSAKKMGLDILSIDSIVDKSRFLYIIAANRPNNTKIIEELRKRGIDTFIDLPETVRHSLDDAYSRPLLEITPVIGCVINCRYCPQSKLVSAYRRHIERRIRGGVQR